MKTEDNEDIVVVTPMHTVAKATQIWQPCQVTRYSQTTFVLLFNYLSLNYLRYNNEYTKSVKFKI